MNIIKNIIYSIGITLVSVVLAFLLLTKATRADDFIEVDKLSVNYRLFRREGIEPMITYDGLNRQLDKGLNLNLDTTIMGYVYWNSSVLTMTDYDPVAKYGQFRTIGLQMQLGLRITEWLDVGYFHLSRHLMDTPQVNGQSFQQTDALELTLKLYSNPRLKVRDGIW